MSLADRLANATPNDQVAQTRIAETRNRIRERLVESLGPRLYDAAPPTASSRASSNSTFESCWTRRSRSPIRAGEARHRPSDRGQRPGLGSASEPFARDPDVTEIMVNSWDSIYVERAGKHLLTGAKFRDDVQLRQIIDKIVARVGRRVDETSPYARRSPARRLACECGHPTASRSTAPA